MAGMVIEFPEEFNGIGEAVARLVDRMRTAVAAAKGGKAWNYGAFEEELQEACAAVERACHGRALSALDVDCELVRIEGELHRRVGRYPGTYFTTAGPVAVPRSLYRKVGERNGKTVDAIALRTGAVDGVWLPATARRMSYLMSLGTSREAEQTARELGRVVYSRSSFETVCHAVGELFVGVQADIEDALLDSYQLPEGATSVSVSLDRVSLPMEEPRPRPVGRPRKGAPKHPCERVFRMAWTGTVTVHGAEGEALYTRRYGRMPAAEVSELCALMLADVKALLLKEPQLHVAILCDGAHELWNLLEQHFNEEALGRPVHRLVDLWHLAEKLGAAAKVLQSREEDADATVRRWKLGLLNRSGYVVQIYDELSDSRLEYVTRGESCPVHEAMTYIDNHHQRMDYASARRLGLAVGSGNVEATCKSLIAVRMKRPGARWKEETGDHVLQLRALVLSDLWDDAMTRFFSAMPTSVRRAV